jgi:hypothetical protein
MIDVQVRHDQVIDPLQSGRFDGNSVHPLRIAPTRVS